MTGFTPGPWKAGNKFEVGKISDADDQSFGMIDPLCDVYGDNRESDARLIAAAPCLLSALQAITNSGPDAIPIKEAFEMAHRAIEMASGGKV